MAAARKGSEWVWRTRTYIRKLLWTEHPECLKWEKSRERGSERGREKGQKPELPLCLMVPTTGRDTHRDARLCHCLWPIIAL